jgi:hypothetical protein
MEAQRGRGPAGAAARPENPGGTPAADRREDGPPATPDTARLPLASDADPAESLIPANLGGAPDRVNATFSTPVDNFVDGVWSELHTLWRMLWETVDEPVGDTPGPVGRETLTSGVGGAHAVEEESRPTEVPIRTENA